MVSLQLYLSSLLLQSALASIVQILRRQLRWQVGEVRSLLRHLRDGTFRCEDLQGTATGAYLDTVIRYPEPKTGSPAT